MFVHELFSAYSRYAKSLGYKSEVLFTSAGHILAQFKGKGVYHAFKQEPGKHCCQRVPTTESKGRWQTSVVSVAVLPMRNEKQERLSDKDIKVATFGGHGPGGQHQNVTDSAVKMTHRPTGITVTINGRSQHANRKEALRILTARVSEKKRLEADVKYDQNRRNQMDGGGRGNKVRTYNFVKSRVVNHRNKKKTNNIKRIMKGEFGLIL